MSRTFITDVPCVPETPSPISNAVYIDIAFADIERDLAAVKKVCRIRFSSFPARTVYEAAKLSF